MRTVEAPQIDLNPSETVAQQPGLRLVPKSLVDRPTKHIFTLGYRGPKQETLAQVGGFTDAYDLLQAAEQGDKKAARALDRALIKHEREIYKAKKRAVPDKFDPQMAVELARELGVSREDLARFLVSRRDAFQKYGEPLGAIIGIERVPTLKK